jgi:regulator of RNase E activity RraA
MAAERTPRRTDFGHHPVVPPRIGRAGARLEPELERRFREAYLPDISDAVGRLYTMDRGIRGLYEPIPRLVGVALTVKVPPGDNMAIHGAMHRVQSGDVLVIDWQGYHEGCGSGAGSLIPPVSRGLAGIVVDGSWRDVEELQALQLPIYGRGVSPFSPTKQELGEINVPVCVGNVIVEPGDVIVADVEGAVVVPRRHATEVAAALREYTPRRSFAEWPHDQLEKTVEWRVAYFNELFAGDGGIEDGDAPQPA